MKKITLVFTLFLLSIHAYCQDHKALVEKQFLDYINLLIKKDFIKSTEYINEDFLKLISKTQMTAILEKTFNNPEVDFRIEEPKILQIGGIRKINNVNYVKLEYSNILRMKFNNTGIDNDSTSSETEAGSQASITAALEAQFGKENVKFNGSTKYYQIYSVNKAIANSKDAQTWKFITVEDRQKAMLETFIPKELLADK